MPVIRDQFGRFARAAAKVEPVIIVPKLAVDDINWFDKVQKTWGLGHAPNADDNALIEKMIAFQRKTAAPRASDCAKWGAITANGEAWEDDNYHCHAGMSRPQNAKAKFIYSKFCWGYSGAYMGKLTDQKKANFIHWLVNDSPFASAFIKKDVAEILNDNCLVATSNMPSNILAGAMISSRRLTEYGEVVDIWNSLVERGVNPDAAFFHAHQFGLTGKNVDVTRHNAGHCSVDGSTFTKKHVLNFMAHTPERVRPHFNQQSDTYSPVQDAWAEGYYGPHFIDVKAIAKAAKEGGKLPDPPKKTVNPFAAANNKKDDVNTAPAEPFFDLLAERLNIEYGKAA